MREIPESGRHPASSLLSSGARSRRRLGGDGRIRGMEEPSVSPVYSSHAPKGSEDWLRALAKTGLGRGLGQPESGLTPQLKGPWTRNQQTEGWASSSVS